MSVKNILQIAGGKMGLNPSDTQQRSVLLRFLNEAALELYAQADVQLWEQVFKVNGDQTISLPSYILQLRAVREFNSYIPWHINQLRPRYNINNWQEVWRNWRIKGLQALQVSVRNEAQLVISVPEVETPPITVSISGPTNTAAEAVEDIVMDAVSKSTVNNYNDVTLLRKDRVNNFDVTISDIDGLEISHIPNNVLEASYLIVDVSTLPWSTQSTGKQQHYVEVLYKKVLPWLYRDNDEYPVKGYDFVIVNKIVQLWKEEQDKPEAAMLYDAKATRSAARIHEDQNRAAEDVISFQVNGYDTLLARLRTNRPGRQNASIYPFGIQ